MSLSKEIESRIKAGRDRKDKDAGMRNLCLDFVRGVQYGAVAGERGTYNPSTGTVNATKSERNKHRVRQVRNHIKPIVRQKVSAATQQVPGYEVIPATNDYDDITAAQLAEKVALAGHELWNVRSNVRDMVRYAVVAGEGFIYPYWDSTVGPFIEDENGKQVGIGEVKLLAFGGNEAFWEPNCRFSESRWHAFERARPIADVMDDPSYNGGKLLPDANTGPKKSKDDGTKMVMVTDYFERPCSTYPEGRHLTIANGKLIFDPEAFPVRDQEGKVIDEPPFLALAWDPDADTDRDHGLVEDMIDPQRAINDGENKVAEWVRLALNPQMLAARGSLETQPNDVSGAIIYYNVIPGMNPPEWRPTPPVPRELFDTADRAKMDLQIIGDADDFSASSITSGSEAKELALNAQIAWASFLADLAQVYASTMNRCLTLVQRYYSEPRMMAFQGRQGWDAIADFRGADLRGQTDCRVNVATIEPRTRKSIEQQVMNIAQMFPGYFAPEVIISALKGGTAEKLIDTYQSDVRRVNSVIRKIKAGLLMQEPMRPAFPNEEFPDPAIPQEGPPVDEFGMPLTDEMGQPLPAPPPVLLTEVPGWMPRPFDGIPVHKATMEDWMKSDEYEALEPDQKEQAHLYYSALLDLESRAAERAAQMQMQEAQDLGMSNATRPPQAMSGSMPALPE